MNSYCKFFYNFNWCSDHKFFQLCIFILMQHFKRLTLLFDKSFGISTEVFFTANLVIALLSITKSIVTYLNAKRYPVRPNIFGTIIFTLAVGMLVVSKFAIVSMNLLNAFYLYPLTHVLNIFLFGVVRKSHSFTHFSSQLA